MTFFYNLNKKLDEIRAIPEKTHSQLNERDEGKPGKNFAKIAKDAADRYGSQEAGNRVAGAVRAKLAKAGKLEEELDEGFVDSVKSAASKALDVLGHGDDEAMIRDLQKTAGLPQTGKVPPKQPGQQPTGQLPMSENDVGEGNEFSGELAKAKAAGAKNFSVDGREYPVKEAAPMTAKQKSFAALAEPKDKITFADKIAGAKQEVDEMLGDVAAEAMKSAIGKMHKQKEMGEASTDNAFTAHKRPKIEKPAVGTVTRGSKHDVEEIPGGRRVTRRVDPAGISVGADDDKPADGEKRGRGRPKGPAKAPERVTGGATKHKGGRKIAKEAASEDDIQILVRMRDEAFEDGNKMLGNKIEDILQMLDGGEEQVSEKAVSKKQQRFMGMVHAAQKGEKPASKEVAKVAKGMGKKDAEDFASTKHKGLPEKKKPEAKKEKTDETTTAGSIAPAAGAPKAKSNSMVGKGIYDSLNRKLEGMIAEGMNVSVNMTMDDQGNPKKNITVSAEDEAAEQLAQLLNLAGMPASDSNCGCDTTPCSCESQELDENQPDWPTNTEVGGEDDPHMRLYSGGVNGPKSTGQTVGAPFNRQDSRQGTMAEGTDLGMKLYAELKGFKAK